MLSGGDNFGTYKRHLPHWRACDVVYFVTWRLHTTNAPLGAEERTVVARAIEHFHTTRYWLVSYVVMDDHVHVIARLSEGIPLESTVHTWKSYSAHQLQRSHEREGRIWQNEYQDRIIRDSDELVNTIGYVAANPAKRWPSISEYPWLRVYET